MIKKIVFILFIFSGFAFATNFNSCQTFSTPDTYDLTSNIQINASSCLGVSSPNIIVDCHGYEIVGNYTLGTYGINIQNSDNFTLQNCIFRQFGYALNFDNGSNALITNNTFDNSSFTGLMFGSNNLLVHNITFINNTVSNNWNNGIEIYNMSDGNFSFNTLFGHEHGHGTDRTGQFVRNVANTHWSNNYMYNNTICFRIDGTNVSDVFVENNYCENVTSSGFLTFTGAKMTLRNNTVTAFAPYIGFDYGWAASTTTQADCANWKVINNTATGGALIFLNASNSSSVISNLNVGALILCDADNVNLSNINLQGGGNGRNGMELMQVNNLTLFNFSAWNVYTGIRGLIVNDSTFDTININGGQISSINFAGGTSSRNNLTHIFISNVSANAGISMGGVGNYVSNFSISNSNTTGWVIGFQSATTAVNNTYDTFTVENTPVAIGITNLGSGNLIKNGYIKNVTTSFFVNSTATGTKTITLENITLTDATESHSTTIDLYDSIAPSEIFYLSLPDSVPAFGNSSYIDLQSYLNRTSIGSANVSTDQLNITIDEIPIEYSRLTWWVNNGSVWQEQAIINNGNGKVTYNGAKSYPIGTSYLDAIFYYDMCPVINQSGYIPSYQNYSGAPNLITGLTNACVIINVSNVQFDCQNPATSVHNWIINDGTATATGVYIPSGLNNVTVTNCNIEKYYYGGYSVSNTNASFLNNLFYNNSITGINTDSTSGATYYNNTFLLNQLGLELAFDNDNNYISTNLFANNSVRDLTLSTNGGNNTISENIFDTGNIAIGILSTIDTYMQNNNISNYGFQAVQINTASNTEFSGNRLLTNAVGIDGSGNTNLSIQNNLINNSNAGGLTLASSSIISIQHNNFSSSVPASTFSSVSNTSFYNNTYFANSRGIYTSNSVNFSIFQNTFSGQTDASMLFANSKTNYTVQENQVSGSIGANGIYLSSGTVDSVQIQNNNVSGVGNALLIEGSSGVYASGNNLSGVSNGVYLTFAFDNQIEYNHIYASDDNIRISDSSNNIFTGNNVTAATNYGIDLISGNNNTFISNEIYQNPQGMRITGANNTLGQTNHFYNNLYSVYVDASVNPRYFEINSSIFDFNASFTNYSNISLIDNAGTTEQYWLNWSRLNNVSPTGNLSYRNTSILFTNVANANVSSLIWHYDPTGLNSTVQQSLDIWNYSGGYNKTNSTVTLASLIVTKTNTINTADLSLLYDPTYTPPPPPSPSTGRGGVALPLLTESPTNGTFQDANLPSGLNLTLEDLKNPYCCIPIFIILVLLYIAVQKRR